MASVVPDDAISLSPSAVWSWRPSKAAWFHNVRVLAERLCLPPALSVDAMALRAALKTAAETEAEWLYHPAVSPIFRPLATDNRGHGGILHLAAWTAAHVPDDLGQITVPDGARLWTPQGPLELEGGWYDLALLGSTMRTDVDAPAIALDPFDTLSGECSSSSPTNGDLGADHDSVYNYLSSIDFFRRAVPEAFDWVTQVARLVAPVRGRAPSSSAFRSASDPETPGLIRLDLGCGLLFTLEALVHESAHNYFYLAEAGGPLVAPDQLHRRFPSPLKARPRPLRGVMLAYHALAHITALYDALGDVDAFAAQPVLAQQYAELRDAAVDAEATCMAAAGCLTDRGRQFLNDTSNRVFRHARQS